MKRLTTLFVWLVAVVALANDGVFYVNGNHLVPLKETDVAVTKEVLTISLCDDGYAKVDVLYEFTNRGAAKTVDMGFEADAPYNDFDGGFTPNVGHPYIHDFTVTMNGQQLSYRTAAVKCGSEEEPTDFVPLDLTVWRVPKDEEGPGNMGDNLINPSTEEYINYAYAYYFKANFKEGKNIVHHTYKYRMSFGVMRTFEVPYWLTPALRWANGQIDDFTLRIKAERTAKYFCVNKDLFEGAQWTVTEGKGKVRAVSYAPDMNYTEVALRNGTVEWHKKNFRPMSNLCIASVDTYSYDKPLGYFYDRSQTYVPIWHGEGEETSDEEKRILRNLPYANRGYVFKDKKLQAYFNQFFWYMPDPNWKQDTSDFTKREWEYVNGTW